MEQYHRNVINSRMSDLIAATFNLESIVKKLLELNIINKWMENHILVRHFYFILFLSCILFMIYKNSYYLYLCRSRVLRKNPDGPKNLNFTN